MKKSAMIVGNPSNSFHDRAINSLIKMAIAEGVYHFYCDMTPGMSQNFARILTTYPVTLTAVIANTDMDMWRPSKKGSYLKLLERAHKQIIINNPNKSHCIKQRDLYMVKRSQLCLNIFTENKQTVETLKMVQSANMLCYQYNPLQKQFLMIQPIQPPKQLSFFADNLNF